MTDQNPSSGPPRVGIDAPAGSGMTTRVRRWLRVAGSAALAVTVAGAAHGAGFTRASVPAETPIDVGIWYPSEGRTAEGGNPFGQRLAVDAAPSGEGLRLVVLSHGNAGWMGGHAATALALADAGFVAVALTHPDDNYQNEDLPPSAWLASRPRDVLETIEFVLSDWQHAGRLSAEAVGVYGFSAGGYTALVAGGAAPDIDIATAHCDSHPEEFVCELGMIDQVADSLPAERSLPHASDPRIGAIAAAAPGLGFAFDTAALAGVGAPVQLWFGALDERVPYETNGRHLIDSLPNEPELHIVEGAGHFSFLSPCDPALETANPRIWTLVCTDADGFDRDAFQATLNAALVGFFDRTLR